MKKVFALILAISLIFATMPMGAFLFEVQAITATEVQQKLQTKMAETGYKPGSAPPSSYLSGSGCYGFVDMLCRYLYGHQLPSQASNHYQFKNYTTNFTQVGNTLTISGGTLTEASLQSLFAQAKPGDVIQMDYTKYDGADSLHTMMVYSVSSSGVVFYHAGSSKVYFGASSGTEPLWGTTGNTLTWAKLKAVLKSSDDGISLYRSKTVTEEHTHSYAQYADVAHPHNIYMQCSCGDTYYTGGAESRWTGTSYDSTHPHNIYRICSCGYTEYTGETQCYWTGTTYENNHPHQTYKTYSCGYVEIISESAVDIYCNTCIKDTFVESLEYNGHTYALYKISTSWQTAKAFCESKDGHLATITSQEEWEFVKWFIDGKNTWLGGYLTPELNWEWVTDEEFSFTDWLPGEPNNASGDEGYLGTYDTGGWNDFPCSAETVQYFLCEYDPLQYTNRVRYNNHTYDVYEKYVSWSQATTICAEKGGHLVSVDDTSERAFLSGVIKGNVCWALRFLGSSNSGLYFYSGVNPDNITTANIFICEYDPITVTFDANGGENAPAAIEKAYEEDIVLGNDKPTRDGYVFLGWSDQSNAEYVEYKAGDTFKRNDNTTLYAMWQKLNDVALDENSSASVYADGDNTQYFAFTPESSGDYIIYSTGNQDTMVYLYDNDMNLISKDDDSGENSNFELVQYLEENKTYIYGVNFWDNTSGNINFNFGKVYTFSYDANGGENAPEPHKQYCGNYRVSTQVPTKENSVFLGWSENKDATTASIQPGASLGIETGSDGVLLYAIWHQHTYDNDCDADCNGCDETREVSGHSYGDWITSKQPTCTENGSKYQKCSICGDIISEEISATGTHSHISVITQPTCTSKGFTTYTCSICGDCYVGDYTDASGHTYDNDFDAICNECNFVRDIKTYGDVNNDNEVNNRDLALLMQYINGWNVTIDTDAADVTLDGYINNKDYAVLMQKTVE